MAETSASAKAEAGVQALVVNLCNSARENALKIMDASLKAQAEVHKVTKEALATPKDDTSRFNVHDLGTLQTKYSKIEHFDMQLKQLNRSVLGTWKKHVKTFLKEQDTKHINPKAKKALREWAAWYAITYWLLYESPVYNKAPVFFEKFLRAEWVKKNEHTLVWLIRTDTWSEDLDVFQTK
ncbi:MAG: hypothetical protein Q9182_001071 [Xanthomendoza sp. 2 TL-2023]